MKTITIILMGVLIMGLVVGAITTTNIAIDKTSLDVLKAKAGKDIAPTVSEMNCDDTLCNVWVKQEGIIQSQIFIPKSKCTSYDENMTCTRYAEYSISELNSLVDEKVTSMLLAYAGNIKTAVGNTTTTKQDGRIIQVGIK